MKYINTSEANKDSLSRWMPTVVAIIAILGQVFYFGQRLGAAEQRVATTETAVQQQAAQAVTKAEYIADKNAAVVQTADIKQSLRDLNYKMDRLIERTQRYAPLGEAK